MAEKLKEALSKVADCYDDFIRGSLAQVNGSEKKQEKLLQYLNDNPDAKTDDVIDYIFDAIAT